MTSLRKLTSFCEQFTTPPLPELKELERETNLHTLSPQMLCGHLQGNFLSLMSILTKPTSILEIGTFTGYSAICLARGLADKGILHTIEVNPEFAKISLRFFAKTAFADKIKLHIGDAAEIIPSIPGTFDLVYVDAAKNDNARYYDLIFDKVKSGGLILVDNVLWSGKIMNESSDRDTRLINAFNRKIQEDDRVENIMLPLRDGIMIARKL